MCQAQPLTDDAKLEKPQHVKISWVDEKIPDKDIGFTFTYKPNPVINNARPDVTITRYVTFSGGSRISRRVEEGGETPDLKCKISRSKRKNWYT